MVMDDSCLGSIDARLEEGEYALAARDYLIVIDTGNPNNETFLRARDGLIKALEGLRAVAGEEGRMPETTLYTALIRHFKQHKPPENK